MNEYAKLRALAAHWMLERKDIPLWWNWLVLTAENPADDSLNLPYTVASQIFADFAEKRLLLSQQEPGGAIVFQMNLGLIDEWKAMAHPPSATQRALGWLWNDFLKPPGCALLYWGSSRILYKRGYRSTASG